MAGRVTRDGRPGDYSDHDIAGAVDNSLTNWSTTSLGRKGKGERERERGGGGRGCLDPRRRFEGGEVSRKAPAIVLLLSQVWGRRGVSKCLGAKMVINGTAPRMTIAWSYKGLPQWHVKDPGHSTKTASGELHLNAYTHLT